jgi:hypothetical protein
MGSSELPATSTEAEAMLELHQERKVNLIIKEYFVSELLHRNADVAKL